MRHGTNIEWTHVPGYRGESWNLATGCAKVSAGCRNCYAERVMKRFQPDWSFRDVVIHLDRIDTPRRRKVPTCFFVNSMSDLFHEDVSDKVLWAAFRIMAECERHLFIILTKRPERMVDFVKSPLPKNIWVGVSVENQAAADERIPLLRHVPAAVRLVSVEPMLGPVLFDSNWYHDWVCPGCERVGSPDFNQQTEDGFAAHCEHCGALFLLSDWIRRRAIHWVICGSESGPGARPMEIEWAESLRSDCDNHDVSFFQKQVTRNGRKIPFEEFPKTLQVRQFPRGYGDE